MAKATEVDSVFKFPVLIGDIGGTNARFALLVDAFAEPKIFPIVQTADFASLDDAIQTAVLDTTSVQPKSAIFAIAGPVGGNEIRLTNNNWAVRPEFLAKTFALTDIVVLNDFVAQALAVVALDGENMENVGGGKSVEHACRVVLGPGTGLGIAALVHSRHTWTPLPGEGGHIDVGPQTPRDYQVFPHIAKIGGRVSAEQMLCGRGLVNLYRAVCTADSISPEYSTATEITASALKKDDPAATETLSLFLTVLGRIAGDMALVFMARGGVFLTGGIIQKIMPLLHDGTFRAAFDNKAPHSALLSSIPVYAITDPLASLAGLSAFARTPARFGDAGDTRRWRFSR